MLLVGSEVDMYQGLSMHAFAVVHGLNVGGVGCTCESPKTAYVSTCRFTYYTLCVVIDYNMQ